MPLGIYVLSFNIAISTVVWLLPCSTILAIDIDILILVSRTYNVKYLEEKTVVLYINSSEAQAKDCMTYVLQPAQTRIQNAPFYMFYPLASVMES